MFGGVASILDDGISAVGANIRARAIQSRGINLTPRSDYRLPYRGLDVPESFPRSPESVFYPTSANITPRYSPELLPVAPVVGSLVSNGSPALNLPLFNED